MVHRADHNKESCSVGHTKTPSILTVLCWQPYTKIDHLVTQNHHCDYASILEKKV